jgi:hypothetical protein
MMTEAKIWALASAFERSSPADSQVEPSMALILNVGPVPMAGLPRCADCGPNFL